MNGGNDYFVYLYSIFSVKLSTSRQNAFNFYLSSDTSLFIYCKYYYKIKNLNIENVKLF